MVTTMDFEPSKWVFAPKRKINGRTYYQYAQACPKKIAEQNRRKLLAAGHRVRLIRNNTQSFYGEYEVWATEK